jgi:hypothetical protein
MLAGARLENRTPGDTAHEIQQCLAGERIETQTFRFGDGIAFHHVVGQLDCQRVGWAKQGEA